MSDSPRAFVSHSIQDNDRFVLDFARRLRAKGINAWLDYWELLPGDSLIDKIWNEGLKDCQAFIVVLSKHSIESKWVREELNTAMVKKIDDNTRLIAVRLDGCEVPEPLRSTIWIDIPDVASYDREFERIVNSIFGQYEKPPLGTPPVYVRPDVLTIDGLAKIDSVIFEAACRAVMDAGPSSYIHGEEFATELEAQGISTQEVMDAQEVLESRGYIKLWRVMGPPHPYKFGITSLGFDAFVHAAIPDYGKICADVARCIVRDDQKNNFGIAKELKQPARLVSHIFESLEHNGLIKFADRMGVAV